MLPALDCPLGRISMSSDFVQRCWRHLGMRIGRGRGHAREALNRQSAIFNQQSEKSNPTESVQFLHTFCPLFETPPVFHRITAENKAQKNLLIILIRPHFLISICSNRRCVTEKVRAANRRPSEKRRQARRANQKKAVAARKRDRSPGYAASFRDGLSALDLERSLASAGESLEAKFQGMVVSDF